MSLKHFHLIFIICSILLSIGFSYWSILQYRESHMNAHLATAWVALFAATGLVLYLLTFVRKMKV